MTALQRTWWCLLSGTNMHKFNDKPNTCGRVDCVSMSGLPFYATSILSVIIIVIQIAVFLLYWIELTKVLARFLGHPKQDPSPVWSYKATSLWVHYPVPKIKFTSPAILNSWAVFYLTMLGFFDEFLQFDCRRKSYSQTIIKVPLRPIPQVVHDLFQQ